MFGDGLAARCKTQAQHITLNLQRLTEGEIKAH